MLRRLLRTAAAPLAALAVYPAAGPAQQDLLPQAAVEQTGIRADGTAPIDRVDIVRQVGGATPQYVAVVEPRKQSIDIVWSDPAAAAGQVNMYYVRLRQRNEAPAWASPLWINYRP